jgi:hypothetical protein
MYVLSIYTKKNVELSFFGWILVEDFRVKINLKCLRPKTDFCNIDPWKHGPVRLTMVPPNM